MKTEFFHFFSFKIYPIVSLQLSRIVYCSICCFVQALEIPLSIPHCSQQCGPQPSLCICSLP